MRKSAPFVVCLLVGGTGGAIGAYTVAGHPRAGHGAGAVANLEVTAVQGGPYTVPCRATVHGQGPVPQGETAAVYAVDEADHQETHWYELVSNFDDSTHWWVNISLKTANDRYTVGAVLISTPLAQYLSTAEKWKDPTYTYWSSPAFPPGALVGGNTMTVTRTGQPC